MGVSTGDAISDELEALVSEVLDAAFDVHSRTGPGLLESAYVRALVHELELRGIHAETEVPAPLIYKGAQLGEAYRIDILVEGVLIVEVKAVEELAPVHVAQTLTYLRIKDQRLGLLLNFGARRLKDGIRRVIL